MVGFSCSLRALLPFGVRDAQAVEFFIQLFDLFVQGNHLFVVALSFGAIDVIQFVIDNIITDDKFKILFDLFLSIRYFCVRQTNQVGIVGTFLSRNLGIA